MATSNYDAIKVQLDTAQRALIEVSRLSYADDSTIIDLSLKNAQLAEELRICQAGHEPPPQLKTTGYGACLRTGNNPQQVVTNFGVGADPRWFDNGQGLERIPTRPSKEDSPLFHPSWKIFPDVPTKAGCEVAFTNCLPGDLVTCDHEYDVKYEKAVKAGNKNAMSDLLRRIENIEMFDDFTHQVRPDLRPCAVMGGWQFQGPVNPIFYAKSDVLGVDLDGANDAYYNWANPKILDRIVAWANLHYNGNITIPEYGWPRQLNDTSGAGRVMAINNQTPAIVNSLRPITVQWFDSAAFPRYALTLKNESDAWRAFVAS